jgi:hypothetical protein
MKERALSTLTGLDRSAPDRVAFAQVHADVLQTSIRPPAGQCAVRSLGAQSVLRPSFIRGQFHPRARPVRELSSRVLRKAADLAVAQAEVAEGQEIRGRTPNSVKGFLCRLCYKSAASRASSPCPPALGFLARRSVPVCEWNSAGAHGPLAGGCGATRGGSRSPALPGGSGPPVREARADARIRTADPFMTSEVLYQLSYVGVEVLG